MSNTLKNLLLALGVLTIGYGAYYLYVLRADTTIEPTTDADYQIMLVRTEGFIQLRQELDQMNLNVALFEDPRFRSLQSYSTPLREVQTGRTNPFAQVGANGE